MNSETSVLLLFGNFYLVKINQGNKLVVKI